MDAGLSLTYLKGISSHLDYSVSLSGSFPDSISKGSATSKKSLFLQSDLSVRVRLSEEQKRIDPFFQTGLGVAVYNSNVPIYFLLGPGVEINYKDVYFTTCIQYRPSLSNNINNHYFYSIGISGFIGKKQMKKDVVLIVQPQLINIARDSDGDGILDSSDACPSTPGLAKYQGCPLPDLDKDGIADEEDQCPNIPGILKYHGCPIPDTDSDGINDEQDSCKDVPGIPENHGCPLIKKEVKDKIDFAAKNIFFKTGSYELLEISFSSLDEVAKILNVNPSFTLTIEGHTDNVGTNQSNKKLSENRANAVMQYLISKGISKNRLSAIGYGQTRPVETNSTTEGRANNRRVELKLNYQP